MPGLEHRAGQHRTVPISRRRDAISDEWLPNQIEDLVFWVRADSLELDGLADGGAVTTWRDESGQGNNVTQATADSKPLYKVGVINGKPAVRFDGTDDCLQSAAFATQVSQPNTIIVVTKFDNADAAQRYITDGIAADKRQIILTNGGEWTFYADTLVGGGTDDSDWHIFTAVFNGASSFCRKDGATEISGDCGDYDLTGVTLGAAFNGVSGRWDGDIAQELIYSRELSSAEYQRVERCLATEYGITLA